MGKGSKKRPTLISREEEELAWLLYQGKIDFEGYRQRYVKLLKEGKIKYPKTGKGDKDVSTKTQ